MTRDTGRAPSAAVLARYGLTGEPTLLPGGQGRSWRVGAAVLKPLDAHPAMLPWQAALVSRLEAGPALRIPAPLPARGGAWVVQGWTAWRYEPGRHRARAWRDIVEVGDRLHAWLRDEPAPPWLRERSDPWWIGDQVAWGAPAPPGTALTPLVEELIGALGPLHEPSQLVHGDLTGNVLFEDGMPPLVIDLSLYWRPPRFAAAVVVADALVFQEGPVSLVDVLGEEGGAPQHLLRALVYRAVADRLLKPGASAADLDAPYRDAAALALRSAAAG